MRCMGYRWAVDDEGYEVLVACVRFWHRHFWYPDPDDE